VITILSLISLSQTKQKTFRTCKSLSEMIQARSILKLVCSKIIKFSTPEIFSNGPTMDRISTGIARLLQKQGPPLSRSKII